MGKSTRYLLLKRSTRREIELSFSKDASPAILSCDHEKDNLCALQKPPVFFGSAGY